jgi:hypothetical protein
VVESGVDGGAANSDDAHRPLDQSHNLAASLSHVETRQVRNDYTLQWDGEFYQIEPRAVVSGLRRANVRVEQRLDGALAVRYGEKYLPVIRCEVAAQKAPAPALAEPTGKRRPPRRGKGPTRMAAIQQEVARRQSSPSTGKLSARPAGKPGDFLIAKESLRRSLPRHLLPAPVKILRRLSMRFLRHGGIYLVRWGFQNQNQTLGRDRTASRRSARAQAKERVGRTTLLLIVRR